MTRRVRWKPTLVTREWDLKADVQSLKEKGRELMFSGAGKLKSLLRMPSIPNVLNATAEAKTEANLALRGPHEAHDDAKRALIGPIVALDGTPLARRDATCLDDAPTALIAVPRLDGNPTLTKLYNICVLCACLMLTQESKSK